MEQQGNNSHCSPTLCRAGCGFYGSSSKDGMCSKCYNDALNRKMQPPQQSSSGMPSTPAVNIVGATSPAHDMRTGSNGSSFLDLSSSPAVMPNNLMSSMMMSASMPVHSAHHMPKPASEIAIPGSHGSLAAEAALSTSPSCSSLPGSFSDPSSPMSEAKKKNRCVECNKKVGLTGFECRCGGMYCPVHRYSDMHKCNFDYKQMGADEIRKNNPAVRGEKVQKL
ncbi:putative AN1-type zinc finger protein 6 [Hypsibius exemplaris]|uniref:AN1-type zinc finger protein 6 n=1 Tax=Hypsibius exemplaris TaxID=2072580 RepID=A0A1W0XFG1_HYPEX|nr:putative AN1-type zinc finger protein 6 [Hypsibius exemplaris]